MADYIYTMEIRLTPDQQRDVTLVQDIARDAGMNVYLTGGAVRDIISGFPIRDLDFTVQGNPAKLQKDLERAGVVIGGGDDDSKVLYIGVPGNVRAELSMARTARYEKTITSNTSPIKQSGMKSSSWLTKRIRCTSCACLKKRTG